MEDEDGEGSNVDSWTIPAQLSYKDTLYIGDEILNNRTNNINDHVDDVGENNKEEISSSEDKLFNSRIIFKGFKKRILAQTQENQIPEKIIDQEGCLVASPKTLRDKNNDNKRGKITEYAQYLGLEPTGKYKCPKCNPSVTFRSMSMLKQHQCECTSDMNPINCSPSTSDQHGINVTSTPNNFHISRKVYLCSACGTYFENWNLFLHMREIHNRHICLFCLGMFGQAERLSHHLMKKHSVPETKFHTIDDFYTVFKESCYLICCSCERVFSETDNFFTHTCISLNQRTITNSVCSVCRQIDGIHLSTCKFENSSELKDTNGRIQASDSEQTLFPNPANAVAKKLLGAYRTRIETSKRALFSSCNKKLWDMYAKKIKFGSQRRVPRLCDGERDKHRQSLTNTIIGSIPLTTTPTPLYKSSLDEESEEHEHVSTSNNIMRERHIVEIDVTKSPAHERIIDRYTDTIMQVSQFNTEEESIEKLKNDGELDFIQGEENDEESGGEEVVEDEEEEEEEEDGDRMNGMEGMRSDEEDDEEDCNQVSDPDNTLDNIERGELILDDGNEDSPSESSPVSPNHKSFNPAQGHPVSVQEELCSPFGDDQAATCLKPNESTNITVSRVNTNNRSLVIKICTNKNSQFSVATSNSNSGNYGCKSGQEVEKHEYDEEEEEEDEDVDNDNEEDDDDDEDNEEHLGEEDDEPEGKNHVGQMEFEKDVAASNHITDSDNDKLVVTLSTMPRSDNEVESLSEATTLGVSSTSLTRTTTTTAVTTTTSVTLTTLVTSVIPRSPIEEQNEIMATSKIEGIIDEAQPISSVETQIDKDQEISNSRTGESVETIVAEKSMEVLGDELVRIESDELQSKLAEESSDGILLAAEAIPSIDLNVSGTLDSIEIEDLLKCCIAAASPTCIYCNHARHIAVNGKQLALHMLAEHRFQPQHPAIIIHRDQFNLRVKKSLDELTLRWFNQDSYDNTRGTYDISAVKTYECYLCRIYYTVHKELYLHNRKMHQKTILICIMCKSTFYSHSELLCHLCPGVYASHINIRYRCCLCPIESLPSAFRLMVHLRKRHHACDVCLEATGNQQRLSNHVWKHKLHHLCYRCGIAYRNKPDITKHLFWKHGTESVLCKKCLQKKWPHIYHFCIAPSAFVCEECGSTFSRAVALKVHKRLHSGDEPHSCPECSVTFISKKLLAKHVELHKSLPLEVSPERPEFDNCQTETTASSESNKIIVCNENIGIEPISDLNDATTKIPKESVRKVLDVYDLPPLNLSSDSDSDAEDEKTLRKVSEIDNIENDGGVKRSMSVIDNNEVNNSVVSTLYDREQLDLEKISEHVLNTGINDSIHDVEESNEEETKTEEVVIMNGIWDNFKSYTASLESKDMHNKTDNEVPKNAELLSVIAAEHDYCVVYGNNSEEEQTVTKSVEQESDDMKAESSSMITSITTNGDSDPTKRKSNKTLKKKTKQPQDNDSGGGVGTSSSSDSSSDSDSSSCSCGTNCSCSSSSSDSSTSSSSSSDSDSSTSESSPKKLTLGKKDRRKDKDKDVRKNRSKDSSQITQSEIPIVTQVENGVQSTDDGAIEVTVDVTDQDIVNKIITLPTPVPLRESDLETDETETDEDFYDEYPQQHANKILTEKRNQLMALAPTAPQSTDDLALGSSSNDIKNGIIEISNDITNSLPQSQLSITGMNANVKRKIKTKRRKKGEGGRGRGRQQHSMHSGTAKVHPSPIVESIKLNIPKFLYRNKQSGVRRRSSSPNMNTIKIREPKLPAVTYQLSQPDQNRDERTSSSTANTHIPLNEKESANGNKRSSKRKRVPKRFYGDSSDEEQQRYPNSMTQKWRKVDSHVSTIPYVPSITIKQNYGTLSSAVHATKMYQAVSSVPVVSESPLRETPTTTSVPACAPEMEPAPPVTDSDDHPDDSSSDSSASEIEQPRHPPRQHPGDTDAQGTAPSNRQANLYCYCQCPYDEVSEMIACDGNDCRIEWFHFECVGIMVPPKGKWYCPDCSKRDSVPPNIEYFD